MRKLLYILAVFVFFSNCKNSEKNTINDQSKRNENWAWWVDNESGLGKWIPTGNITTVKNGKYTLFYFNGNIYETGKIINRIITDTVYKYGLNNELVGYVIHNGSKKIDYILKDGPFTLYYKDGSIYQEGIAINHLIGNKLNEYDENGKANYSYESDGSEGVLIYYTPEGKVKGKLKGEFTKEHTFLNDTSLSNNGIGLLNGIAVLYYESGYLKDSFNFVNGYPHGVCYQWYENGSIKTIGKAVNGNIDGESIGYHQNGKLKFTATMKNGKPDGVMKYYDTLGKFINERKFQNGVEIK